LVVGENYAPGLLRKRVYRHNRCQAIRFGHRCLYSKNSRRYARSITPAERRELIAGGCIYCGADLSQARGSSMDRIDNEIGYHVGNVVPCCGRCNTDRGTLTFEEWWLVVAMRQGRAAA
jgi:hypothetical protein